MTHAPHLAPERVVRVRNKPSLLRNGLIAFAASGIPVFGALLWLGVTQGTWPWVLVILAVTVVLALLFVWRHHSGFTEVRGGVLRKQAFASRVSVPVASIARIVLAETYEGSSADTAAQLLALDARNRRVMRMRGRYWSAADMRAIAEATGAPILVESDPLTLHQFYGLFHGTAYWYEGRRWLAVVAIALGLFLALLVMAALLHVLGVSAVTWAR